MKKKIGEKNKIKKEKENKFVSDQTIFINNSEHFSLTKTIKNNNLFFFTLSLMHHTQSSYWEMLFKWNSDNRYLKLWGCENVLKNWIVKINKIDF